MTRGLWARTVTILILAVGLVGSVAGAQGLSGGGLDVVMVLDHSGSMKRNDPQRLMIRAARDFVGRLGSRDAVGVVVFGGQARAVYPLASLVIEGKRESILAEIDRIRYDDPHTNMSAGIERGMYEIKQHGRTEARPILIFITDGIMDTGSKAKDAEMREWLRTRLLPEARQRGISIFSIAFTEEADYPLIQEMASVTGGGYYRAISAEEIVAIFDRIHAKQERRPAATPLASAVPSVPGPTPVSGPIPIGFWVAGGAGLVILLLAGVIAARRLRQAAVPAAPPTPAPSAPPPLSAPAETHVPQARLRDLRTGKMVELTKPVTRIGRERDNDLVIPEPQVSGHHAEIEWRQGHFYVRDLRSTNGTWIDKQRVETETILKSGDVIHIDEFGYAFSGPDIAVSGTTVRDLSKETLVREVPQARPSASVTAETVLMDMDVTVDDSAGPRRCPVHPNFEATERCDRCGDLWCALCNPPVPGKRVCRRCREAGEGHPGRPVSRPGGSPPRT